MYYHHVGESDNSYTRMVFINEMLSGQDEDYLQDLIVRERESAFAFDASGFYICLTGLPKRVYSGRYGLDANDNMVFVVQFERRMKQALEALGGQGEIVLYLYEDKQIVVVFSFAGKPVEQQDAYALRAAQQACEMLQQMYESTYLKDGAYANVTLLSQRLTAWNQIGAQMRRMNRAWERSFFQMKPEVWTQDFWSRKPQRLPHAALSESRHQLQQAVITGDGQRVKTCLREILLAQIQPTMDEYLLSDTLSWLKRRFIDFSDAYGGATLSDDAVNRLFDAALHPNIEWMCAQLEQAFEDLTLRVAAQDCRYGILVQRALRLLKEQATMRDLSLTYTAERLNVSPAYLSSVFKREVGMSLTRYITQLRIDYAQKLLRETTQTVEQIAQTVGFEGKRYFGTLFKRETGMTPQAYRQRVQDEAT